MYSVVPKSLTKIQSLKAGNGNKEKEKENDETLNSILIGLYSHCAFQDDLILLSSNLRM